MNRILQCALIVLYLLPVYSYAACNIVNGKMYGDCAGVTLNNGSKGIIKVSSYKAESGIIDGARVLAGGSLYLSGISNGDITVNKNGKLVVTGIVNGAVKNNGGVIEVEGEVSSVVANAGNTIISGIVSYVRGSGKIVYKSGAVIAGQPVK